MSNPKGKIKFSRLRLSQKSTSMTGSTTESAPSKETHISKFFQNPNEISSSSNSSNESTTVSSLKKRKTNVDSGENDNEKISTKSHPAKKGKNQIIDEDESPKETTTNSPSKLQNSQNTLKITPKQTSQSEAITKFFSSEKDESLHDFQLSQKPVPKLRPKTNATTKRKAANGKKKQTDIRKCLQKPCTEDVFNRLLYDHCVLDNIDPDQLQLALAMSRSLEQISTSDVPVAAGQSENRKGEPESNVKPIADSVKQTIEKFAFKPKYRNSDQMNTDFVEFFTINPQTKAKGNKWKSRCTPLTRRKAQWQQEKIKKKVDEFLIKQVTTKYMPKERPDDKPYELISPYLQKMLVPEAMLFRASMVETDSLKNIKMYYTNNLVPSITTKSGALLRDWNSIPGRDEVFECIPMSVESKQIETLATDLNGSIAEPSTSQSSHQSDSVEESCSQLIEDSDKTIDLEIESQDIEEELNIINTQIQTTNDLVDISLELIKINEDVSESIYVQREESPDLFGDSDINDSAGDTSCDSESIILKQTDTDKHSDDVSAPKTAQPDYLAKPIIVEPLKSQSNTQSTISMEAITIPSSSNESAADLAQPIVKSRTVGFNLSTCIEISDDECDIDPPINRSMCKRTQSTGAIQISIGDKELSLQRRSCSFIDQVQVSSPDLAKNASTLKCEHADNNGYEKDFKSWLKQMHSNADASLSSSQQSSLFSQCINSSQESIEISDDEINYSMNQSRMLPILVLENKKVDEKMVDKPSREPSANRDTDFSKCQIQSVDLIEISDDEMEVKPLKDRIHESISQDPVKAEKYASISPMSSVEIFDDDATIILENIDLPNQLSASVHANSTDLLLNELALSPLSSSGKFVCSSAAKTSQFKIAENDLINESVAKMFEESFNYRNSSIQDSSLRRSGGSSFRKTQSSLFPEHKASFSFNEDCFTININKSKGEASSKISNSQYCTISDEFDMLVNGGKRKSTHRRSGESNFRKTQSAAFPKHKATSSLNDDSFDTENKIIRDTSFTMSTSQYCKISDEFDMLVNGGKRKSSQASVNVLHSQSLTNCSGQNVGDDEELDLSNADYIIKVTRHVPKPNFEKMDEKQIVIELKKHGLKESLKRRQAIICLEHIYTRTHPYMEHVSKALQSNKSEETVLNTQVNEAKTEQSQLNFNKGFAKENIVADNQKQLIGKENNIYLPSNPRTKKPWCLQPLHIAWYNLLRANSDVHEHILLYKPIDLTHLKTFYKSIEMNFDNKDLIGFFDQHCITFQTNRNNKS